MCYDLTNMTFKVSQSFEYEGCPVVIRYFDQNFEYLTCINNQIYSSYIVARKSFFQRILGLPYSKDQIHKITNYMLAMAQATINTVKGIAPPEGTPSPKI